MTDQEARNASMEAFQDPPQWQRITKKTLLPEEQLILSYFDGGMEIVSRSGRDYYDAHSELIDDPDFKPTHWMPLPEPPTP